MSILQISQAEGKSGPVLVLSGETDTTTAPELADALTAQVAAGAMHLTVDVAALRFADTASIRALMLTARAMSERGGLLELANPQPAIDSALRLMGVHKFIHIRPAEAS